MSQCPKCGGPTREKFAKAIGTYTFCGRCGPKFTPPYTPERIALATGAQTTTIHFRLPHSSAGA